MLKPDLCWPTQTCPSQDHRVVVRIDSWESTSLYPNGHSVRVLGRAGELETEIQTILIENCIHVLPFSDAQVESRVLLLIPAAALHLIRSTCREAVQSGLSYMSKEKPLSAAHNTRVSPQPKAQAE